MQADGIALPQLEQHMAVHAACLQIVLGVDFEPVDRHLLLLELAVVAGSQANPNALQLGRACRHREPPALLRFLLLGFLGSHAT